MPHINMIPRRVLAFAAFSIAASPALAQWYWPPDTFSATPACATEPSVAITIGGQWPDGCTPSGDIATQVAPGRVDITIDHGVPADAVCPAVIRPWSRAASISMIPDGSYDVYVTLTSLQRGQLGPSLVGQFTIACGAACIADLDDGSGSGTSDGAVTIDDLVYFLGRFEAGDIRADVSDASGQPGHDGAVTIEDLILFLRRFEAGC